MNDNPVLTCAIIYVAILLISIFVFFFALYDYTRVMSEVKPRATTKQQIMDYPCRDNSPTLKAAEAKVSKRIDKIKRIYCIPVNCERNNPCRPNGFDCGAVEVRR